MATATQRARQLVEQRLAVRRGVFSFTMDSKKSNATRCVLYYNSHRILGDQVFPLFDPKLLSRNTASDVFNSFVGRVCSCYIPSE